MPHEVNRYPHNPLDPSADLSELLREILRRLNEIESNPLIQANLTAVDPATGNTLVSIGKLADGTAGLLVQDVNGRVPFGVDNVHGQVAPFAFATGMASGLYGTLSGTTTSFRPGTNSATFVELWRADFFSTGATVGYDLTLFPNGGTMEWRILCYESPTGTPTVVVGPTAEAANIQRQGTFNIPAAGLIGGGTDVVGRFMTVRVEGRLTSGSLTADIAQNAPFYNHG